MLDRRTVFEIHRLYEEGKPIRQIARVLGINRGVAAKYLKDPRIGRATPKKSSKLDPFKEEIKRLIDLDSKVSAVVIRERIAALGYNGGLSILREYLAGLRESSKPRQAVLRFESLPGEQCQIDWGALRLPDLRPDPPQAVLPGGHRSPQPACLPAIHPLPETGQSASCPDRGLAVLWRRPSGDRRGQYAHRRHRADRTHHPFQRGLPRIPAPLQDRASRLPSRTPPGKRQDRKRDQIHSPQLLAPPVILRPGRPSGSGR